VPRGSSSYAEKTTKIPIRARYPTARTPKSTIDPMA